MIRLNGNVLKEMQNKFERELVKRDLGYELGKWEVTIWSVEDFIDAWEGAYGLFVYHHFLDRGRFDYNQVGYEVVLLDCQHACDLWEDLIKNPFAQLDTVEKIIEKAGEMYPNNIFVYDFEKNYVAELKWKGELK